MMKNIIFVVSILCSTYDVGACVSNDRYQNVTSFLSVNSEWKTKPTETFNPISSLQVLDKTIWIETYKAEYFPVNISIENENIYLENLTFRRKLPVDDSDDPALLVEKYNKPEVGFKLLLNQNDCFSEIMIVITKDNKLMQKISFERERN